MNGHCVATAVVLSCICFYTSYNCFYVTTLSVLHQSTILTLMTEFRISAMKHTQLCSVCHYAAGIIITVVCMPCVRILLCYIQIIM